MIKLIKRVTLLLILIFGFLSCDTDKKYSDYSEDDFYEVQGVITNARKTSDPFDSATEKNISFSYFLDRPNPKTGLEKNLEMFEAQKGYPIIVLVHKDDENISFYGRVGILENLNTKEVEFLSKHFEIEIEKIESSSYN